MLQRLVLPQLRLRDIQALRQSCKAVRGVVSGAQPELEALALVSAVRPPVVTCAPALCAEAAL